MTPGTRREAVKRLIDRERERLAKRLTKRS